MQRLRDQLERLMRQQREAFQASLTRLEDRAFCPACGAPQSEDAVCCAHCAEKRERQEDLEFELHRVDRWLRSVALPDWTWARFENYSWCACLSASVREAVRRWDLRTNLVLSGPSGVGKS